MRIICINTDETFKNFIHQIMPSGFQVNYWALNGDEIPKPSTTDIYILSPINLSNSQKTIIKKLFNSIHCLISFQQVDNFLKEEKLIQLDFTISKNNFAQILKLQKLLPSKSQNSDRLIDYDISRGYIHDINNKIFIPLSALNTIKNLVEKPSNEFNKEKFLKVKNMAEKSLQEAEQFSGLYRKLFLQPKEVDQENSTNILSTIESVFRLLKYKSEKTHIPLTLVTPQAVLLDFKIPGSEVIHLQILSAITAFFLNLKKRNQNSKIIEIQYAFSAKDNLNLLYLSCHFGKDSQQEIDTISQSVELKNIFGTLQTCFEAVPNTKLKILKLQQKIIFLFSYAQI